MDGKFYISAYNMPPKIPIYQIITSWLLLEYLNSPSWAYGAFWTFYAFVLLAMVMKFFSHKSLDIVDTLGKIKELVEK